MPTSRRRASARAAAALVVTAAISLAASVAAQAAPNPVSITVNVGYSGFVKPQQWIPATVDVTNKGPAIDGTLEVTVGANTNGPPIGSAIYESHLTLPSGATKHLKTFVVEDQAPTTVSARIVQSGRVVASGDSQGGSAATILIGVLSDQPTALDSFAAVHPGSISATVVHLSLEDIGDSAVLLRAFDLLAIDDFATDSLTAAQRVALTDYVQNGGALLLGTGASWRKTLAGLPSSILPMNVDGTAVLNSVGALDNLSGLEVATGAAGTGSRAWVSEGAVPLMTEMSVGSGLVTVSSFDWNRDPIASWTGSGDLLRQVLVRTIYSSPTAQSVSFVKGGFGGVASATERSNALSQALGSLPALDLPSLVVIGLLVLAYVLLVGPVNYFVLRAVNRRALAWITVPLIAIVASAGAFGAGLFTKGRSVEANQVSIIHLEPGWDRAYVESYTGLVTPTRGDYQVGVSGIRPLVAPLSNYNGGPINSSPDLIRVSVDDNSIVLPGMTAFVLRGFTAEGVVTAPKLVATATLVNGKLTGTVQNDSSIPVTDAVVIAGDGYQLLKALAPGASATFDFAPKATNLSAGPPAVSSIYTPYYGPQFGGPGFSGPSNPDRVAVEKTSILSLVASGAFSGFSPTITPMVVAWTNQDFEPITLAGIQPHTTAETALVLPLRLGQIGAGSLPSGLVVSRYTDIEGDSQPGPPGAIMTQNGTVAYDFTPAIAQGLHLTGAAIDASAQAQFGGPPGSTASAQAEAWDWSASAWMPLTYVPQGITALPQSAVNPTTSEVRLKFSANGSQVMLGVMSLKGTVK
jgi:hypothetical protein